MTAREDAKDKAKPRRKSRAKGCVIVPAVLLVAAAGAGGIGWSRLSAEHRAVLKRAQSVGTGSAGGYTAPQGFWAKVTETRKFYAMVAEVAEVINTDDGNALPWPTNDDTSNTGRLLAVNTIALLSGGTTGVTEASVTVDRLSNLVGIFNTPSLDFRNNHAEGDDLLGDAYEYLIGQFASGAGKKAGEFYTPQAVSTLLARIVTVAAAQLGPIQKAESRASVVARMIALMEEAKAKGAGFIVYPELALTTFFPRFYEEDRAKMDHWFEASMPGPATQPLFDKAKALGMAMDREYITGQILRGGQIPSYNFVPMGMNDYTPAEFSWKSMPRTNGSGSSPKSDGASGNAARRWKVLDASSSSAVKRGTAKPWQACSATSAVTATTRNTKMTRTFSVRASTTSPVMITGPARAGVPTHHDEAPSAGIPTLNSVSTVAPTAAGLKMCRPRHASTYFEADAATAAITMPTRARGSNVGRTMKSRMCAVMSDDSRRHGSCSNR